MIFRSMIFRNGKTCVYYITSINLILIVLATPSNVNPGPFPQAGPLTIFYNNVEGLNMTKFYELHGHIFKTSKILGKLLVSVNRFFRRICGY